MRRGTLLVLAAVVTFSACSIAATPARASVTALSVAAAPLASAPMAQAEDEPDDGRGVLSVGLAPVEAGFDLRAGESQTFTATFYVAGNEPVHAVVDYHDALLRETGFEYLEPGEEYWSAGSWLTVEPSEFEVEPSGRHTLSVTVTVPEDVADGEYYAAFSVRGAPREGTEGGTRVSLNARMISVVCVAVGENVDRSARLVPYAYVPRGETGARGWDRAKETLAHWLRCLVIRGRNVAFLVDAKPVTVFVPLENTCEAHLQPRVTASFYEGDSLRRRVTYSGEILFPGRSEVISLDWPAPPLFGRLRLELEVEYGGREAIMVERTFWAVPVKGLLGLAAAAFGLGYLSATRGRRMDRRPPAGFPG